MGKRRDSDVVSVSGAIGNKAGACVQAIDVFIVDVSCIWVNRSLNSIIVRSIIITEIVLIIKHSIIIIIA